MSLTNIKALHNALFANPALLAFFATKHTAQPDNYQSATPKAFLGYQTPNNADLPAISYEPINRKYESETGQLISYKKGVSIVVSVLEPDSDDNDDTFDRLSGGVVARETIADLMLQALRETELIADYTDVNVFTDSGLQHPLYEIEFELSYECYN